MESPSGNSQFMRNRNFLKEAIPGRVRLFLIGVSLSSMKSVQSICVEGRAVSGSPILLLLYMVIVCHAPALAEGNSVIKGTHMSNVIAESKEKPERGSDHRKHLCFRPYDVLSIYLVLFTHAE